MANSSKGREYSEESFHFFTVILPLTLEEKKLVLKIPQKFVMKFGDDLSSVATLRVPNGRVWQVGVVKERGKIWLDKGWSEFVEYHSISLGHLLVFQFRPNSNFHVAIFDTSASEIEYPISDGEEPENGRQNFGHQNNMESDDEEQSVEILGSTTPNSSLSSLGNKIKDKSTRAGPSRNVYAPSHKNEPRRAAQEVGKDALDEGNQPDHQEFYSLLEEMGICIYGTRRNLTVEERQRALLVARLFNPRNGSFLVILKASYLEKKYVYVPKFFFVECLSRKVERIKIQDCDGKEWPVSIMQHRSGCLIGGDWHKFQQEKNLEEGDICVFELMRNDDFLLKVSVHKINP